MLKESKRHRLNFPSHCVAELHFPQSKKHWLRSSNGFFLCTSSKPKTTSKVLFAATSFPTTGALT
ncbi:Hypothetical predicted protein [Podarcis lilfordi]|uniref:Uncharacterized protein n=1 Tax=Podarcis lilfordi TaxID=74358 RepID=A0AA35JUK5_9SAUR|nr:Hypothetical predicted protein [Podarcis lilfordi]